MAETKELEIKLYQLLKEGNWSDEAATEAVNAVKGLQREANKELATKTDLADLKVDLITKMYIASSVATVVQILGTLGGLFGILKFMQVL